MALKDIFTMVKADRYTADGREAIINAREAEVEDKTYQIGEISQKTGLQKTANGWVKPKKGGKITPKGKDLMERAARNPKLSEHGRAAASKLAKEYGEKLSGSNGSESTSAAKFDEYGLPSNETIKMKNKFLKEENVADPSKLTNAEFNALAEKLDKKLGICNKERAQELLVAEAESKPAEDSAPRVLTGDTKIRVRK